MNGNGKVKQNSDRQEKENLPTIPVSDRQAKVMRGIMISICTVYFTVLLWVFVVLPSFRLLTRFLGSPRP